MTGRPSVACLAGLLLALAMTAACDGRKIHLGDGREGGAGGPGGAGGTGGPGGTCGTAHTSASQVLWIGDSWVLVTGSQHTRVTELARAAGAIGPNDDYVIGAAPAATMAAIANQYAAQQAGSTKVKVLIMDGGVWDTLVAGGSDSSVESVASTFGQMLAQIAGDGTVEHIVYFLLPELPGLPGVAALRPRLQQLCGQSSVPCHFIDLDPVWAGHSDYTSQGPVPVPTDQGSLAMANAIWMVMQLSCIAR